MDFATHNKVVSMKKTGPRSPSILSTALRELHPAASSNFKKGQKK